jgi:hypothetical protein
VFSNNLQPDHRDHAARTRRQRETESRAAGPPQKGFSTACSPGWPPHRPLRPRHHTSRRGTARSRGSERSSFDAEARRGHSENRGGDRRLLRVDLAGDMPGKDDPARGGAARNQRAGALSGESHFREPSLTQAQSGGAAPPLPTRLCYCRSTRWPDKTRVTVVCPPPSNLSTFTGKLPSA